MNVSVDKSSLSCDMCVWLVVMISRNIYVESNDVNVMCMSKIDRKKKTHDYDCSS